GSEGGKSVGIDWARSRWSDRVSYTFSPRNRNGSPRHLSRGVRAVLVFVCALSPRARRLNIRARGVPQRGRGPSVRSHHDVSVTLSTTCCPRASPHVVRTRRSARGPLPRSWARLPGKAAWNLAPG